MIAVLALLALAAGPALFAVAARRLRRRATAGQVGPGVDALRAHATGVDALRAHATDAEARLAAAGLLLFAAGVLTLAVMAVWG